MIVYLEYDEVICEYQIKCLSESILLHDVSSIRDHITISKITFFKCVNQCSPLNCWICRFGFIYIILYYSFHV